MLRNFVIPISVWIFSISSASGEDLVNLRFKLIFILFSLFAASQREAYGRCGCPPAPHLQQVHQDAQLHGDSPARDGSELSGSVPARGDDEFCVIFSTDLKVGWDSLADNTGEFVVVYPLGGSLSVHLTNNFKKNQTT